MQVPLVVFKREKEIVRSLEFDGMKIAFRYHWLYLNCRFWSFQVPLVVFKREKEIARSLEFDGMWIAEQPADEDIRGQWDKLVISTRSFPDKYWDKFVKKKVNFI